MSDTLSAWINGVLKPRYGTMRAIAELIGMSESGFTRGVKRGTLSVENLLDLARATDIAPSKVLQMAGKARVEKLIESLYGASELSASERQHLQDWRDLSDDSRSEFSELISKLAERDRAAAATDRSAKKRKTA